MRAGVRCYASGRGQPPPSGAFRGGVAARDAAEDQALRDGATAKPARPVYSTCDLSGCVKAGDRLSVEIDDLSPYIDLNAAHCEVYLRP